MLFRLHLARIQGEEFEADWPGWIPIYAVQGPRIGGSAGDVRLRQLRNEFDVPIAGPEVVNGTHLYKLQARLTDWDFEILISLWREKMKWKYHEEGQLTIL